MFKQILSSTLIAVITLQPVIAATTEYRIPLNVHIRTIPPGAGDGVVDPGDNPTAPVLTLSPNALRFDLTGGARDTKIAFLTNGGTAPLSISDIAGNPDFSVNHDCPSPLPAGVSCTVSVTPTTAATAASKYALPFQAPGLDAPAMLGLSTFARTVAGPAPVLHVSSGLVDLGRTLKPGESASGSVTLTNIGDADATLGGISSGGDFNVGSDCPSVLSAGARCTITATFSSYVPGSHSRTLALTAGVPDSGASLTYSAYVQRDPAKTPALAFDISILMFGTLEPGASATKTAHLTNKGTAPAILQPFELSTPFTVSHDCPSVLAIGSTCAVSVTYTASSNGANELAAKAQDAALAKLLLDGRVHKDDQASSTSFTPSPLTFGAVPIGQAPTLQATLTNTSSSAAAVKSITLENNSGAFSQTNDCGSSIAAGASCTVSVTFKPSTSEQRNAWVTASFSDDSRVSLPVSGTGQGAVLAAGPTTVPLGAVMLPGASQLQRVSLGNNGNVPLTGLTVSNTDSHLAIDYGDCTNVLQPNKGCTLTLQYTPERDGPINSTFKIGSDNGGSATVTVTGQALAFTASPTSLTFPATHVGTSAADQSIVLSNKGQAPVALGGIGLVWGAGQFGQSNNCGARLDAGASCTVTVRYSPSYVAPNSSAPQGGTLGVVANDARLGYGVEGTAINPQLALSATSLTLPATALGQVSSTVSLAVRNPSSERTTFTGITVSQGASEFAQSNDCGAELAPGARCTVNVQFSPTAVGTRGGALSIASSFAVNNVSLSGQGLAKLELSTTAVSFPPIEFGKTSAPQTITVTNRTPEVVTFTGMSISQGISDFGQSNDCGSELASGASCTVSVQFKPSQTGDRSGTWTVVSSLGTDNIKLSGQGVPKLTLSTSAIAFPAKNVGQSSAAMSIVVSNFTDRIASWSRISVNPPAADFAQTSNCGTSLAIGASCTINVTFTPTTTGDRSGSVALESTFGTDTVGLTGTGTQPVGDVDGVAPSDNPSDNFTHYNIAFLNTDVGMSSAVRNIKFTNKGTGPLTVQGISMLAGFEDFKATNDCPTTLGAGQSCTISLIFAPSITGARTGQVVLLSETGNYAFDLGGNGTGVLAQITADSSNDFGTVKVGATAQRSFTFRNTGTKAATNVVAALSGTNVVFTANTCGTANAPAIVGAGSSCAMTVQYAPQAPEDFTGQVAVSSSAANGTQSLQLKGIAVSAQGKLFADTDSAFGDVTVGETASRTFTFTNTGTVTATGVYAAVTGTGMSLTSNTCGTKTAAISLDVAASCAMTVKFEPTSAGAVTGALSVASSALNSPNSITLTGTGTAITTLMLKGESSVTADESGGTLTAVGSPSITNANSIDGAGSLLFASKGSYLLTPTATRYALGTTDFTIESWVRPTSGSASVVLSNYATTHWAKGSWVLTTAHGACGNKACFFAYNYNGDLPLLKSPANIPLNTWTHIAITRAGSAVKMFINGVLVASNTTTVPLDGGITSAQQIGVGMMEAGWYDWGFSGQLDDVRIVRGLAAYSSNFAPPSSPR